MIISFLTYCHNTLLYDLWSLKILIFDLVFTLQGLYVYKKGLVHVIIHKVVILSVV